MTHVWKITTPPLAKARANDLAERLEDTLKPRSDAIALFEADEERNLWLLEAYYQVEPASADLTHVLGGVVVEIEKLDDVDWVSQSLSALEPISAGRFFVHGSHDRDKCPSGGICVEIDAGLAFGTGHHGTTRGCLLALDHILKIKRPRNVLDVGCGSGVLAIAVAAACAIPVIASDIDPEAVQVAKRNAVINKKGPLVRTLVAGGVFHNLIAANSSYELVFANILAGPLVRMSASLARHVAPGGNLVLSGLLHHQEARIISAYRIAGLPLKQRWQLEGWSTLLFSRRV
jgi:ribosomal protein L11 methyltransferase